MQNIDIEAIKTLRFLAVDEVEKANSGHPGLPLGTAPLMYTIWDRFMKYNPENPNWVNRDRFVLSPGHGSALLYAMLHVAGYDLSIDELKNFRQWGSKTPGHPEYGMTPGVDVSTGPLGHGFAMGVGFALAESILAAKYNKDKFNVVDHYTYGITSDGDLMEGVAAEAASLAGTLGLGKLIYLYDDNKITIEGTTDIAFSEDVEKRFKSYDWQVLRVNDSEDIDGIAKAIKEAQADTKRPSLIIVRTHIGFGSPKQDSPSCHGEPLGADAMAATKAKAGWPTDKTFYVPEEVASYFKNKITTCKENEAAFNQLMVEYKNAYPELAEELIGCLENKYAPNLEELEALFKTTEKNATREASGDVLQVLAKQLPGLIGGSADLGPSNKTVMKDVGYYSNDNQTGRNIHYGVREHAMGAIMNGLALHGGIIPFGGTFLVFADFLRPTVRMAALMETRSIFVLTHDSVAVGEDGPTHQPVEHAMSLRMIPNTSVIRPADALETASAWYMACTNNEGPTAILLSRQKLPVMHQYAAIIHENARKGAYVLNAATGTCQGTIIATGSEVQLALGAQTELAKEGINVSVVSMPSWDVFEKQDAAYKNSVIPNELPTFAVEAGVSFGWARYTKTEANVVGINTFGASAPGDIVMERYGMTVANVVNVVKNGLRK